VAVPRLRVREIGTGDGPISATRPVPFLFSFFLLFSFLFWHPDRTAPSRHHPFLPQPSFSPHHRPIWSFKGKTCWNLWVVRASNVFPLFCRQDLAFQVDDEIFSGGGCSVGYGFGDVFQLEFLSITLSFG
jgi:hypothetical protein